MEPRKPSTHKEWRKVAKKFQRKRRRRLQAKQRDEEGKSHNLTCSAEEMALQLIVAENIRQQNEEENEKWMRSELLIEKKKREQQRELDAKRAQEGIERNRIAAERSAEVKRKLDLAEEKARIVAEKREREADLLRRIGAYIDGDLPMPPELNEMSESNSGKQPCQFFVKTATCRYGNKCIWNHCRPKVSRTLLVRSFFTNIRLEQSRSNEYGTDLSLEFDEAQLFRDYCDFFDDVVPEFLKFGAIEQFVTCQNYEPHLRGHVYIEYTSPRNALKAYREMNGRYYAMRMINIDFCNIEWKTAICGLSMRNVCPKGRNCAFLHIFKNPRNQFPIHNALKKLLPATAPVPAETDDSGNTKSEGWDYEGDSERRNWRWSESPERDNVATNSSTESSRNQGRNGRRNRSQSRSRNSSRASKRMSNSMRKRDKVEERNKDNTKNRNRSKSRSRHKKSRKRSRSQSTRSKNDK